MKVLWLCNIMLPAVAEHFHRESSNKEGWLSGLLTAVLSHGDSNGIELAVAFPVAERLPYSAEAAGSDTVDAADRKNVREQHDGQRLADIGADHGAYAFHVGRRISLPMTLWKIRPARICMILHWNRSCGRSVRISHRTWCIASERNIHTPWLCAEHSREKTGYWSEYRDCAQCMQSAISRICRKRL